MQKNTVSHFEIYANDPKKLAEFYTKLFDWKTVEFPQMDYIMVHTGDTDEQNMLKSPGAINGGIARRPDGFSVNGSVNYSMVDSIEDATAKAKSLGAKLTKEKTAVPGMGWFSLFTDPEGRMMGLWKPKAKAHE